MSCSAAATAVEVYDVGTAQAFWCVCCKQARAIEEAVFEGTVEKEGIMSRTRFMIVLGGCSGGAAGVGLVKGRRMCRGCAGMVVVG